MAHSYIVMSERSRNKISRRDMTKALATVGAASLAGCSLGGDGGDGSDGGDGGVGTAGELGERVPSITVQYFLNIWATGFFEDTAPIAQQNWRDGLGVDAQFKGAQVSNLVGGVLGGKFSQQVVYTTAHTTPPRLDPTFVIVDQFRIDGAGSRNKANTSTNWGKYASCEYSIPAWEQENAPSREERRELVNQAIEVLSNDYMSIPIAPSGTYGALDEERLNVSDVGTLGITNLNAFFTLNTHPKDGGRKVTKIQADEIGARNPYLTTDPTARLMTEYSTLIVAGPEGDLQPYLAEDWEVSNEAKTFTFTLKDATFQDGTPITASDVKYSFEFVENNHPDLPGASGIGYESIETPDEKTVVVNFAEPSLKFLSSSVLLVGIINEEVWSEAENAPAEFAPPNGRASGPFAVKQFETSRQVVMDTHEGHPMAPDSDDMAGLVYKAYNEESTLIQALGAGEVHQAPGISFSSFKQAGEKSGILTEAGFDYLPNKLVPDYCQPPTKFKEFRLALGKALNRQEMQAVGLPGLDVEPELHSRPYIERHPWAAPEERLQKFTEKPTGDREGARQVLADAGWGWDDRGNLHYPPDADLSPRWPEGEAPSPENFPCLDKILDA